MEKISLSGIWKINSKKEIATDFSKIDLIEEDWFEIEVPSHYQTHPKLKYYPETVYYRKNFFIENSLKGKTIRLNFKGVFYFCKVFLNESYLGEHTGYFQSFNFEVSNLLKYGEENILSCEVSCPREINLSRKKMITGVFSHWDCKDPEAQPGGIWQDVELLINNSVYINNIEINHKLVNEKSAKIFLRTEIIDKKGGNIELFYKIKPTNFSGESLEFKENKNLNSGINLISQELIINNPKLWWIHNLGFPHLYNLQIEILRDGKISDCGSLNFGIREIKSKNWHFYLNGKRIFCKGTNYAPADIRIAQINKEFYEKDVQMMLEANMNMVRIHAHIDKEEFYQVCDEKGILVWQDFPLQWGYDKAIEREARKQIREMIKLLRHHPSIAVWCCHNEPFLVPATDPTAVGILEGIKILFSIFVYNWNKDILDRKLEKEAKAEDKTRVVVRASGLLDTPFNLATDFHIYCGWYLGKMRDLPKIFLLTRYRGARFCTEYGAQAFPNIDNFKKITSGELKEIDWNKLKSNYMLQPTLMEKKSAKASNFDNLQEYICATQEYQAKLNQYHHEIFRRLKYKPCGGILQFMFVDCCPGITWSIVDYWREPKLSYEITKNCFSPIWIMADFPKESYKLGSLFKTNIYVVNDTYNKYEQQVVGWQIQDNSGKIMKEGIFNFSLEEDSKALQIGKIVWEIPQNAEGNYLLKLKLQTEQGLLENKYILIVKGKE